MRMFAVECIWALFAQTPQLSCLRAVWVGSIKPLQKKRAMRWCNYKSASRTSNGEKPYGKTSMKCFVHSLKGGYPPDHYSLEVRCFPLYYFSSLQRGRRFSERQDLFPSSVSIELLPFQCISINTSISLLRPSIKARWMIISAHMLGLGHEMLKNWITELNRPQLNTSAHMILLCVHWMNLICPVIFYILKTMCVTALSALNIQYKALLHRCWLFNVNTSQFKGPGTVTRILVVDIIWV